MNTFQEISQYVSIKDQQLIEDTPASRAKLLQEFQLKGFEIYLDDLISRDEKLAQSEESFTKLANDLKDQQVKRLHCSYWAYPTAFLGAINFQELVERFGSLDKVIEYYGDITGKHIWQRWIDEYKLACKIHAQSYVFHLIDYPPIDGLWEFNLPIDSIIDMMVMMLQKLINRLIEEKLLDENSPLIEIESSGWGLEHGIQSAEHYKYVFSNLYDPYDRVRIGWDLNHLLHAVGVDTNGKGVFYLMPEEISSSMRLIEEKYGNQPQKFAQKWLASQILDPYLLEKVGALHISDNQLKDKQYFVNGKLQGKYYEEITAIESWDDKEEYGVEVVLSKYDNHLPLGEGVLDGNFIKQLIEALYPNNRELVLLHELKNSQQLDIDLEKQINEIKGAFK